MATRWAGALRVAAGGVLRGWWRIARALFHEIAGALFVLFAALGAAGAWREWKRGAAEWVIAIAVVFALGMAAFAVASFRSARRVR